MSVALNGGVNFKKIPTIVLGRINNLLLMVKMMQSTNIVGWYLLSVIFIVLGIAIVVPVRRFRLLWIALLASVYIYAVTLDVTDFAMSRMNLNMELKDSVVFYTTSTLVLTLMPCMLIFKRVASPFMGAFTGYLLSMMVLFCQAFPKSTKMSGWWIFAIFMGLPALLLVCGIAFPTVVMGLALTATSMFMICLGLDMIMKKCLFDSMVHFDLKNPYINLPKARTMCIIFGIIVLTCGILGGLMFHAVETITKGHSMEMKSIRTQQEERDRNDEEARAVQTKNAKIAQGKAQELMDNISQQPKAPAVRR